MFLMENNEILGIAYFFSKKEKNNNIDKFDKSEKYIYIAINWDWKYIIYYLYFN